MYPLRKFNFTGDENFATPPATRQTDEQALAFMHTWMLSELPCIAGKRETIKKRYMIKIATQATVPNIFNEYSMALKEGKTLACLLVFNDHEYTSRNKSVSEVFYYLAEQMQKISKVSAHALANGDCLTKKITLRCPVTQVMTEYDDFECIAFCPQSNNQYDPLYDPLMALPFPAVNMSSDMFAFSSFVAEMVNKRFNMSVVELSQDREKTEQALFHCVEKWQRFAAKTIENYEMISDTSLCPVHLNKERNQWVAGHKDPAFAEQVKESHTHELPVLYGKRIVEEWLAYFYDNKNFSASGLARDGELT